MSGFSIISAHRKHLQGN